MNTDELDRRFLLGGLAGVAGISALAAMAKGGPLNPPAGPVASTGKTLTDVEPRTPINDTTCPGTATHRYIISSPGSYYLTDNVIAGVGVIALNILADCEVDLNGYAITGGPTATAAITIPGASRLRLRNGAVAGWGGVSGTGRACVMENLWFTMTPNTEGHGVELSGTATVRNCVIEGASNFGLFLHAQSLVESCTVRQCAAGISISGGAGSVIRGCIVSDCRILGVIVTIDSGGNGYARVSNNLVRNCSDGILCLSNGTVVEDNVLQLNASRGVHCSDTGNVIIRNIVTGSTTAFSLVAGNRYGPIVNIPGAGTPAVTGSSAASTMGSTDPTANFVF